VGLGNAAAKGVVGKGGAVMGVAGVGVDADQAVFVVVVEGLSGC